MPSWPFWNAKAGCAWRRARPDGSGYGGGPRCDNLVAARMFGTQQRPVGPFQQLVQHLSGQRVFGRAVHRNADRCGYTQPQIGIAQLKRGIANPGAQAVRQPLWPWQGPCWAWPARIPRPRSGTGCQISAGLAAMRRATCCKMSSPALWPCRSLISLKWSRSIKSKAKLSLSGVMARSSCMSAWLRLCKPVSGSKAARPSWRSQRAALGIGQLLVGNDLFQPQPGFRAVQRARSGHLPRPDQAPLRHWHGPRAAG